MGERVVVVVIKYKYTHIHITIYLTILGTRHWLKLFCNFQFILYFSFYVFKRNYITNKIYTSKLNTLNKYKRLG